MEQGGVLACEKLSALLVPALSLRRYRSSRDPGMVRDESKIMCFAV